MIIDSEEIWKCLRKGERKQELSIIIEKAKCSEWEANEVIEDLIHMSKIIINKIQQTKK